MNFRISSLGQAFGSDRLARLRAAVERLPLRDEALLALVVGAMVLPLLSIRGYHFEEGLTVALAKDTLTGSPWYVPDLFGARWIERPVMQSWLVALVSLPFGGVSQITARLPTIAALFVGAVLIARLLRPRVSRPAALFAALCFLFSPAVLQKAVTAEADILLSVFEFAAFFLWWRGYETGRLSIPRWLAIALLLAATALCKGPQPAAFFALGVGASILVKREWRMLPGYVLAGVISLGLTLGWYVAVYHDSEVGQGLAYMRLNSHETAAGYLFNRLKFLSIFLSFLPGLIVAAPPLWNWLRRRPIADVADGDRTIFLALALYTLAPMIPLALWPSTATRYATPALLAIAAIAGLAFDRICRSRGRQANLVATILCGLAAYQLVLAWIVAPLAPDLFRQSRRDAQAIEAVIRTRPGVVYSPLRSADNVLAYLPGPVVYLEGSATPPAPSYFLAETAAADRLAAAHPELSLVPRAAIGTRSLWFYEVKAR